MEKIIEIENLNFKYQNKIIFDNLNLTVNEGTFLTIGGQSGCGKSTLLKMITGFIETDCITVCHKKVEKTNLKEIRKEVSIVFENPKDSFTQDLVIDNLVFPLENLNYTKEKMKERVQEVSEYFKIEHLLDRSISTLSGGEQEKVALSIALITHPKILLLDESLIMLDELEKEKALKLLKKLNKDKKITIILVTHDMEESTYGKEIAILNNGKIISIDKIKNLYKNEKIFKNNGLNLPFMANLSLKLKYYELVDDVILDMDKMVNHLWK